MLKRRSNIMVGKIFALAMGLLLAVAAPAATYSGGKGEQHDPFRIATPQDLNDIGNHPEDWDKFFVLVNDINMAGYSYKSALIAPDRSSSEIIFQGTPFTGIFDGNDHVIANLTVDTKGENNDYLGLFGRIAIFRLFGHDDRPSQVKNLGLEDVNITGGPNSSYIGGLVGESDYGSIISNCYSSGGNVLGGSVLGGLVGWNWNSIISNCYSSGGSVSGMLDVGGLMGSNRGTITICYSTASVSGHEDVGGLVGSNYGTVTSCYSSNKVQGELSSNGLGGLVGFNIGTITICYSASQVQGEQSSFELGGLVGVNLDTIARCYSTGQVRGGDGSFELGGLVGNNWDWWGTIITSCYSTASVSGDYRLGGLVGKNESIISNCYSTGSVSGNYVLGGLVGSNFSASITNCYSTGKVLVGDDSLNIGIGGLVGSNWSGTNTGCIWNVQTSGQTSSAVGIGKTTAQMQTEATFTETGWDFVTETVNGTNDIWTIKEGAGYPQHVWPLVNLIGWYEVDLLDYAFFAHRWQQAGCSDANDCDGADLDFSDKVDWADLNIFSDHWLEGDN